ncbi:hypothetical protein [Streptomyces sp. NPDC001492]
MDRVDAMVTERHAVRAAAYQVARAARVLAAELDAEDARPDWEQTDWTLSAERRHRPGAHYTRAALDIVAAAGELLAAAVAADRAAGDGWHEIGRPLGVSPDTAARRYRPRRSAPADDNLAGPTTA